jgi:HEAT repeat protein
LLVVTTLAVVIGLCVVSAAHPASATDGTVVVRVYAAGALWRIDEKTASDAVPVLAAALRSAKDEITRRWAAQQILGTGPEAVLAVPALVENLSNERIAHDMADALGRIGPRAVAAVEPLTEVLRDEKGQIRVWAAEALWRIRRDGASLQPLTEALGSDDPWTPSSAAIALGNIGPDAKAAAAALTELLEHPEGYVRQTAADALKKINATPKNEG